MSNPEIPPAKIDRAIRVMEKQFADKVEHIDNKSSSADSPTEQSQLWDSLKYSPNESELSSGTSWVGPIESEESSHILWLGHARLPRYDSGTAFPNWAVRDVNVHLGRVSATSDDPTNAIISRVKRRFQAATHAIAADADQERARLFEAQILKLVRESDTNINKEDEARLALDVGYIAQRLQLIFTDRQARIWLESHNMTLGGRPLDALRLRGTSDVIAALDVEEQSAY